MAEAIGFAIVAAVAEGTVVSASVATLIGGAALLTAGVGVNLLASSLSDTAQKVAAQQYASRQPVPARQFSYGRVKLAGSYVQYKSSGGSFYYGLYHGEGPWDGFEQWWLDDILTNVAAESLGGTVATVPWRGYVAIDSHLGQVGQAPSTILLSTPGWDYAHLLSGCAYSAVKSAAPAEKKFKAYFPKGVWPSLRVVARTAKVRNSADPAQTEDPSTWKFSTNPAWCIRHFLTGVWGLRIPVSAINDAKFAAFAAVCDQPVTRKDGTVISRYALHGTFSLTDDPIDTLTAMLNTCDGRLTLEPDGTVGIVGGTYVAPTVTLTSADVLSMQLESGSSKFAAFNRLKITYVSPPHDYQQVEGQSWDDVTAQSTSGELLEEDFNRPWVNDFNQVRRLAKIYMAKNNPRYRITGVFKLSAAPALFEDVVQFTYDSAGINMPFQVTRAVANLTNGTVTLDLVSLDPAMYSFNSTTEEGTSPTLPNATATPSAPPPPTGLVVSLERRAVNGSLNASFLRLRAQAPANRPDVSLIGRVRVDQASDYTDMVQDGDDPFSLVSPVLVDGQTYSAEGATSTYGRALVSDYVVAAPATIKAVSDTASTGAPTNFSVTGAQGSASYSLVAPNSPNFSYVQVYRATTSNFSDATLVATINGSPNQTLTGTDKRSAGTFNYWVRAFNGSGYGDSTSTAGPVSATVT